jgi:hypothetical protein
LPAAIRRSPSRLPAGIAAARSLDSDRVRFRLDRPVHRSRIAIHPDWRELIREIANTGIMTCVLAAGRRAQREG